MSDSSEISSCKIINNSKLFITGEINDSLVNGFLESIHEVETKLTEKDNLYNDFSNEKTNFPLEIIINSSGGKCYSGMVIYDYIKKYSKRKIITYTAGICASMAGIIFLAGDERIISENGIFLIHEVSSGSSGKLSHIKDSLYGTELVNNILKKIIIKETNILEKELDDMFQKDTYFTPNECLKYGVVNKIDYF